MRMFEAVLIRPAGVGTWTYVDVPFDVQEAFGSKGQVRVRGTVNGAPYRGTLMPHGNGAHYLVVNRQLREAAGVIDGGTVTVTVQIDDAPREVETPADFLALLDEHPTARETFLGMSYSHRKEYVAWIEGAKKADTRNHRMAKAIAMLSEGKRLK